MEHQAVLYQPQKLEVMSEQKRPVMSNSIIRLIDGVGVTSVTQEGGVLTVELPRSGFLHGKKGAFLFNLDLACETNEAQLCRGVSGMVFREIRTYVGSELVDACQENTRLIVQHFKHRRSADWFTAHGNQIGYYASATDIDGLGAQTYLMYLPDDHFLANDIDLSNLPNIKIEFEVGTSSTWSTTNTGSNPRTFTISNMKYVAVVDTTKRGPEVQDIHYTSRLVYKKPIASGETTFEWSSQLNASGVRGVEVFFYHTTDLTADSVNDKLWDTQGNSITSAKITVNSAPFSVQNALLLGATNKPLSLHLKKLMDGYGEDNSNHNQYDLLRNDFDAAADGDFVLSFPVAVEVNHREDERLVNKINDNLAISCAMTHASEAGEALVVIHQNRFVRGNINGAVASR